MVDLPDEMRARVGALLSRILRGEAHDPCALALRRLRGGGPQAMQRYFGFCLGGLVALIVAVVAAAGLLSLRLSQGPIGISELGPRIAHALDRRVGDRYSFSLGSAFLQADGIVPALGVAGLTLQDAKGRPIIAAPNAQVSLDPLALLVGDFKPKRLQIYDVDVRLSVLPDGSVAVSAGSDPIILTRPLGLGAPEPTATSPIVAVAARAAGSAPPMRELADVLTRLVDLATSADSPFAALERVGIARGKLVFDDRTLNETTVYSGFELSFAKTGNGVNLRIAADGPNGRWTAAIRSDGVAGGQRTISLDVENISLDEIALVGGLRDLGFDFDMPISAGLRFGLGRDGTLAAASGTFSVGSGYFYVKDRDHEPMLVDRLTGGFHWNDKTQKIELDPTEFSSGQTHFELNGTVTPPQAGSGIWQIEADTSPGGVAGAERPGETPIPLQAQLSARLDPGQRKLIVDRFALTGPVVNGALNGDVTWGAATRLRVAASVGNVPLRPLIRLWPSFIAAPVRAWFLEHMLDGMLDHGSVAVDYTGADLAAMHAQQPLPDESTRIDYAITNATVAFLPGVPPLAGLDGRGYVTGRTANFVATRGFLDVGGGRRLTMTDGNFQVPDTSQKPPPAKIAAHLLGSLDTVADILSRDALKNFGSLPIDTMTVKGQVDANLKIDLKLAPNVLPDETNIEANANVSNFSVDKLIGKEKLDQATLTVSFDHAALHAQGTGRMFGAPATIELKKPPAGVTEANVSILLDDAARAKLGWSLGPALTGPVAAHVVSALGQGDTSHGQVELDLSHAAIAGILPGYLKPEGRPAKATFGITTDPSGILIDQLVFEGGSASLRGALQFGADGSFIGAQLTSLKLSPGDDMKVDIDQTKEAMKVNVRGATIDARPFIAMLRAGDPKDNGIAKDLDLDLKAPLVTGNNSQALTAVDLHLSERGGGVRQFQLAGRFGRNNVTGILAQTGENATPQIAINTSDAGALLSFFDLYRRMEGGYLQLAAQLGGGRVDGQVSVRDFILRDEPAIRRLVTEGVAIRDQTGGRETIKIDPTAVSFTKLQANFTRSGGRLDIRDGVMFGSQIGTKIDGWLDFARDRVNINGTFVPAYGVNNLFSQIPVFGMILGGGTHEGLFAVNFRISGQASAPVLSVNPLSAIAPGFLRKIFGAIDFSAQPNQYPPMPPADPGAPLSLAPMQ